MWGGMGHPGDKSKRGKIEDQKHTQLGGRKYIYRDQVRDFKQREG